MPPEMDAVSSLSFVTTTTWLAGLSLAVFAFGAVAIVALVRTRKNKDDYTDDGESPDDGELIEHMKTIASDAVDMAASDAHQEAEKAKEELDSKLFGLRAEVDKATLEYLQGHEDRYTKFAMAESEVIVELRNQIKSIVDNNVDRDKQLAEHGAQLATLAKCDLSKADLDAVKADVADIAFAHSLVAAKVIALGKSLAVKPANYAQGTGSDVLPAADNAFAEAARKRLEPKPTKKRSKK